MTDGSGQEWFEADELRRLVPVFAFAIAIVAVVTQPSSTVELVLAVVPVVAFGVWTFFPRVPLPALAVAMVVPVVIAPRSIR